MNAIKRAIDVVGSASELARRVGVTTQAVCFWRDDLRKIPPKESTLIERATSGAVTRRDLRPDDWRDIWPELAQQPAEAEHA